MEMGWPVELGWSRGGVACRGKLICRSLGLPSLSHSKLLTSWDSLLKKLDLTT